MSQHLIDNPDERPVVLLVDDAPSSLGVLCETLEGLSLIHI